LAAIQFTWDVDTAFANATRRLVRCAFFFPITFRRRDRRLYLGTFSFGFSELFGGCSGVLVSLFVDGVGFSLGNSPGSVWFSSLLPWILRAFSWKNN
jgi:hypothetical protein